jgi:hypothetical protein
LNLSLKDKIGWFLIAYGIFSMFKGGGLLPSIVSTPATAATYVYEKDDTAIPNGVTAGINRLNRETKIVASIYEDDTTDGMGEVPAQFKAAHTAAKEAGLPAFVVTGGDKVLEVVKSPTTAEQVWEAAQ